MIASERAGQYHHTIGEKVMGKEQVVKVACRSRLTIESQ
jgi:hypothetical protein